jgi:arginyl-tRNA synthetase
MADPEAALGEQVRTALAAELGPGYAHADPVIRPSQFADFQSNAAMALSRKAGMAPRELAARLARRLAGSDVCQPPEVSGPGFLNLMLRDDWISAQASGQLADPRLGVAAADPAQRIVVDYSGPNVAKELHVGHLRPTVVGDAVVRVLEYQGHDVIRAAHLGDWGTQFGMLLEHLLDVGEEEADKQIAAGEINAFYQAAKVKFDGDPAFAGRSRRRVVALQSGDPETQRLWRRLVDDSMAYLRSIYSRLGITLRTESDMDPESFYNPMLADVCGELEAKGVARISDGALCAFPPGFTGRDGSPLPLILRKSDGGYGYATTDVAAIRYRTRDLRASRLVYVVGSEQVLHFAMVFATAREAGWLANTTAEHAVVGLMTGADRKRFRTREGESAKLADLVDEAVRRAEHVISDRYDDPEQRRRIAEAVGIGALKYADLSVARETSYVLDFGRMLALTGNTGPYLQYATARIRSIFARAGLDPGAAAGPVRLGEAAERELALRLLGFGRAVHEVAVAAEPHKLAGFLFEVATAFTTFYEQCPVLQAPDSATRDSRLALSALTLRVLVTGLDLLGIPVPERM